jgi:hypothetical protein
MTISRATLLRGAAIGVLVTGISLLALLPTKAEAWWYRGSYGGYYAPPPVVVVPRPYAPPPIVYAPRRAPVWVPPHWRGPYWVPGHWA